MVAHHYTEADHTETAVDYWQRAGERARHRSANQEAIGHLTRGLELLTTLPETPARDRQELDFQVALCPALNATRGHGSQEVMQAYRRAQQLCEQVGDASQLFPVLWGLLRYYRARGDLQTTRELGDQLLTLAQQQQEPIILLAAHQAMETTLFLLGEFAPARQHMEQGLAHQGLQEHRRYEFLGLDHRIGHSMRSSPQQLVSDRSITCLKSIS